MLISDTIHLNKELLLETLLSLHSIKVFNSPYK